MQKKSRISFIKFIFIIYVIIFMFLSLSYILLLIKKSASNSDEIEINGQKYGNTQFVKYNIKKVIFLFLCGCYIYLPSHENTLLNRNK